MRIDVITAFPSIVSPPLNESIIKRAVEANIVDIRIHDLRNWTRDKHHIIDDTPYGGGAGMVFKVEPLFDCLKELSGKSNGHTRILLTSPRGKTLDHSLATKFSLDEHVIVICTRYKGVDQRIEEFFPIEEVSIGDFIISGGELAALVIIDSIVRLLPGAISDIDSAWSDSFNNYLLDCDYYTRPEEFNGHKVPGILLSGDHQKIDEWQKKTRRDNGKKTTGSLQKIYKRNKE